MTGCPPAWPRPTAGFTHGPGAFKVDFAVEGGVPWTAEVARRCRHRALGGSLDEVVAGEQAVHGGQMPERPFVLVGQQYLADPAARSATCTRCGPTPTCPTATPATRPTAIIDQIERFAPGFRDRIVGTAVRSATEMAVYNPNYVGGDIIGGASIAAPDVVPPTLRRRPVLHRHPRRLPVLGVDTTRCRRPRHVRCQRRSARARRTPPLANCRHRIVGADPRVQVLTQERTLQFWSVAKPNLFFRSN